ncbi:hypothetical protein AAG570_012634 [Ranatra chinensis]|uniref:Reverse transcriptase domain-containing protein n=1 Tax=Ranatra chinensis TaxID=642074 RepID=A0ABD0YEE0_9HEMI
MTKSAVGDCRGAVSGGGLAAVGGPVMDWRRIRVDVQTDRPYSLIAQLRPDWPLDSLRFKFGFREYHSTIQQCHRVIYVIASAFEKKQYCTAAFLDETQAFDRVWHEGLLWKLKRILPFTYYLILKSFLTDRFFRVGHKSATSSCYRAKAEVPQGSIAGPFLYNIHTSDIPTHPSTFLASYADDKAILSVHTDPSNAALHLQQHLDALEIWHKKWRIKVNPNKSKHVTFTLRKGSCPRVYVNRIILPTADVVRYLGLRIDKRLTWNPHTRLKRLEVKEDLGCYNDY